MRLHNTWIIVDIALWKVRCNSWIAIELPFKGTPNYSIGVYLEELWQGISVSVIYTVYSKPESGWQDLNLRHPAPKAGALPSCATSRFYLFYPYWRIELSFCQAYFLSFAHKFEIDSRPTERAWSIHDNAELTLSDLKVGGFFIQRVSLIGISPTKRESLLKRLKFAWAPRDLILFALQNV